MHGGRPTPEEWPPAEELADVVTVVAMGRRGYGFSDDGPEYSHHREAEDIAAVLDAVGPPRWVYGSSSGAVCVLAAAQCVSIDKMILFEPALSVDRSLLGGHREEALAAVQAGQLDNALELALRHAVRLDDSQVAARRKAPDWPARLAFAAAWVRDCVEIDKLPTSLDRYRALEPATLLLWATATHPFIQATVKELASVLPSPQVVAIPNHGHAAAETAPHQVAAAVRAFLVAS